MENASNNLTARNAWREIRSVDLAALAEYLLFQYATRIGVFERHLRELNHLVRHEKTARRAVQVAEERHRGSDPRTAMFVSRANEKMQTYLRVMRQHPVIYQKYRAERRHPKSGSAARVIYAAEREGLLHLLAALRHCAKKRGVKLGLKRLLALADCANPDAKLLHSGTLARFLARPRTLALANFLHACEGLLERFPRPIT